MSQAPHLAGRLTGPVLAALLLALPLAAQVPAGDDFRDDFADSPAVEARPDPAADAPPLTRPAGPEGFADFIPDEPLGPIGELLDIRIDPDSGWRVELSGDPGTPPPPEPLPGAGIADPAAAAAGLATEAVADAPAPPLPRGWVRHEARIATARGTAGATLHLALPEAFAPLDADTAARLFPEPGTAVFADVDMDAMIQAVVQGGASPSGRILVFSLTGDPPGSDHVTRDQGFSLAGRGQANLAGGLVMEWVSGVMQEGPFSFFMVNAESPLPVSGDGRLFVMMMSYDAGPDFQSLALDILDTVTLVPGAPPSQIGVAEPADGAADPFGDPVAGAVADPVAEAPLAGDPAGAAPVVQDPEPERHAAPIPVPDPLPAEPGPVAGLRPGLEPGPAADAATPGADPGAEILFWESVRDSADPAALAAYLQRWPEGHFAPLARLRLAARSQGAGLPGSGRRAPDDAAAVPSPPKAEPAADHTGPARPAASAEGVWEISADGATRPGTLTLARGGQGWSGLLNLDQGHDETLHEVSFDPASGQVGFTRRVAGVAQVYTGTLDNGRMSGAFTMSGWSYRWSASRAGPAPGPVPVPDAGRLDIDDCRNRTPPGRILDPRGAVMACRLAVAQRPDDAGLHSALGRALRAAGSPAEAIAAFQAAAELGHVPSMTALALAYRRGEGVAQDDRQAVAWYLRAAEGGDGLAMNNLGFMQARGLGGLPNDQQAAAQWYQRAAEAGDAAAMGNLGERYRTGNGVPRDLGLAEHWLRRGAEAGDPPSMTRLGAMLSHGDLGRPDQHQALVWFRRAADLGDGFGMAHLGRAHALGDGVATDPGQAAEWFDRAARNGGVPAVVPVLDTLPRDTLRALQRRMAGAGVYQGAIDGVSGPLTRAAVEALGALGP